MTSPYAALLRVRRVEEQQAEQDFALTRRHLLACDDTLAACRSVREAWLTEGLLPEGFEDGDNATEIVAHIEIGERSAQLRVDAAQRRLDEARDVLIESRRRREAVETLHVEVLTEAARAEARRVQAELDEFAGMRARARQGVDA